MSFTKGDPRAADAGRKAMRNRWTRPGNEAERAEQNRRMNTARLAQYRDLAYEQGLRLGLILSPSQLDAAAQSLLKADLRDRLAVARAVKAEMLRSGAPEETTEKWRNDRTVRDEVPA